MTDRATFNRSDLRFFGAVTASVSHEMKNVLAIINEMMGLLDDLAHMAAAGRPLDLQRLQQIAEKMKRQIQRGDGIVRGLNRFAHSVDACEVTVDLGDLTGFVTQLAKRRASLRNIDMDVAGTEAPIPVITDPFALEHLLWACLEHAVVLAAEGAHLKIEVNTSPEGPSVRFSPLQPQEEAWRNVPDSRSNALAERLDARLISEPQAGVLTLILPEQKAKPLSDQQGDPI